jgi:hypothetical protein
MKLVLILLIVLSYYPMETGAQNIQPIGFWREHLPFNNAIQVSVDKLVYCATPYGFFTYDQQDASFERKTKINGLSEVKVRLMEKDPLGERIVLVYENTNIDFLDGTKVINLPDVLLSNVSGDRTAYGIYWQKNLVYLCTGLGIIVLDADRNEVKDTYRPSSNGGDIRVNDLVQLNGLLYAATTEGLKMAAAGATNLADYNAWQTISGNGLSPGSVQRLATFNNALIVQKNDSILIRQGNSWSVFFNNGIPVTGLDTDASRMMIAQSVSGKGRIQIVNTAGNITRVLQSNVLSLPRQTAASGAVFWVADQNNGLLRFEDNEPERVFPNSPISTAAGEMIFYNKELWATAGAVNENWNYTFNPNGIHRYNGDQWSGVNLYIYPQLDSLLDFITVAADAVSGSLYAGSYGGGLLEIKKDNSFRIYKQQSALQPAIGDPGSYRVSGLAADVNGNLWVSNYGAPQNLLVKKADGNWRGFTIPFFHNENAIAQIIIDDLNYKWIMAPKGNGVFCFDDRGTLDVLSDDRWRYLRQGKGNGNLPSSEVYCMAKDLDGFIWIGTGKGIAVVQCVQDIFSGNLCEAVLPVVQQDNFAGFLFADEEVRCIAVDGANRKWVGTRNGLWLISADGQKVISRFTESNSPLLSNVINSIAIDPLSGEVFISTFNGICSYRGSATEGTEKHGDVLVFPNPVPPGYGGTIAIRGLANNALVKITETDGRLVFQTKALGGQAIWNGRNYNGEKASSGVYLVIASDENNKEHVVSKIFFVR